jgi:hypothetical protein
LNEHWAPDTTITDTLLTTSTGRNIAWAWVRFDRPSVLHHWPVMPAESDMQVRRSGRKPRNLKEKPNKKKRRGPKPGALRRYDAADRELFPELERIMKDRQMSPTAAAHALAEDGKVKGSGTNDSRAKRLAALYQRNRDSKSSL